jgi:hypothetical protein
LRSLLVAPVAVLAACHHVSSDAEAELAYLGLDAAVGRSLTLGLHGFSEASSANIATQTGEGDVSGTMTVDGQVDQGASDNKGLRLDVSLEGYADLDDLDQDGEDEVSVTYDTPDGAPAHLELKLRNTPDGTFTGTFDGTFVMTGDLVGDVTLALTLAGGLEPDPDVEGGTRREAGTLTIQGTATNEAGGVFHVDVAR